MKKVLLLVAGCWMLVAAVSAQNISQRLQKAFGVFEADSQLRHAISSLYVINAKTGEVVFDKNSQVGLAGASTQKIITAATAFELLGKDFRYKTDLGYYGELNKDTLEGEIIIHASGDPTFGSWRYENTKDSVVRENWRNGIKKKNIKFISGNIWLANYYDYSQKVIPDGWIWQDIGNYYGAAAEILNWKENQYDVTLASGGQVGSKVVVIDTNSYHQNELKAAAKGTGDNAYAYIYQGSKPPLLAGTIPINEPAFKISISNPDVVNDFLITASMFLGVRPKKHHSSMYILTPNENLQGINNKDYKIISTNYSPPLDSIIYWFLKKSINLYGEALVKTFAYEKQGFGSTDSGVAIVRKFWKEKGLDENELNIYDGSGLSPLNRLTTHAQVEVLKYAKTRDWFPYFYDALPEYNGMKMKSGTISDVKGFCGYQKSKDGNEYIFSFLVNNYNGRTSGVVNKMYKVLDELK
ncbi:MAG: D-alanyl-D-alanine carboxypeptidase/D-alanyl-D-alanine-endopeptidase [Chitinophagaceae bacterium]